MLINSRSSISSSRSNNSTPIFLATCRAMVDLPTPTKPVSRRFLYCRSMRVNGVAASAMRSTGTGENPVHGQIALTGTANINDFQIAGVAHRGDVLLNAVAERLADDGREHQRHRDHRQAADLAKPLALGADQGEQR